MIGFVDAIDNKQLSRASRWLDEGIHSLEAIQEIQPKQQVQQLLKTLSKRRSDLMQVLDGSNARLLLRNRSND
jgi:hypothetical protein